MQKSPATFVNSTIGTSVASLNADLHRPLLWSTAFVVAMVFSVIEPSLDPARTIPCWGSGSSVGAPSLTRVPFHSLQDSPNFAKSTSQQLAVFAFGLWGFGLLQQHTPPWVQRFSLTIWLLAALIGAGIVNFSGTDAAPEFIAPLSQAAWFAIGVFGIAREFKLRDLARLALIVTGWNLASGAIGEIATGVLQPESTSYRFAGGLSPDVQGINCVLLVLSALALARRSLRNLPLYAGLIALGMLFLFLTKSPQGCSALLMAVIVAAVLKQRDYLRPLVGIAIICICLPGVVETIELLKAMNWTESVGGTLLKHLPLLWPCSLLPVVLLAMWRAQQRFLATDDEGYRFAVVQIVVALIVSLTSTYYLMPSFGAAICAACLVRLAAEGSRARGAEGLWSRVEGSE